MGESGADVGGGAIEGGIRAKRGVKGGPRVVETGSGGHGQAASATHPYHRHADDVSPGQRSGSRELADHEAMGGDIKPDASSGQGHHQRSRCRPHQQTGRRAVGEHGAEQEHQARDAPRHQRLGSGRTKSQGRGRRGLHAREGTGRRPPALMRVMWVGTAPPARTQTALQSKQGGEGNPAERIGERDGHEGHDADMEPPGGHRPTPTPTGRQHEQRCA